MFRHPPTLLENTLKKVIDYDPLTGITQTFHGSDDGESFTVQTTQDTTDIIDENRNSQNEGLNKNSDLWHAASIPIIVQMEWLTKHGVDLYNKDHWHGVKRLLNSSDYAYLRRNNFVL